MSTTAPKKQIGQHALARIASSSGAEWSEPDLGGTAGVVEGRDRSQRVAANRKHCGRTVRTWTTATSGSASSLSSSGAMSSSPTSVLCS
jgi:hypothetical protein